MRLTTIFSILVFFLVTVSFSQEVKFPKITYSTQAELDEKMQKLAGEVLKIYKQDTIINRLNFMARAKLIQKDYATSLIYLDSLSTHYKTKYPYYSKFISKNKFLYASIKQKGDNLNFDQLFTERFSAYLNQFTAEKDINNAFYFFTAFTYKDLKTALEKLLAEQKDFLSLEEVAEIFLAYERVLIFKDTEAIVKKQKKAFEVKNFIINDSIVVKNKGAEISLQVARKKGEKQKQPTIVMFSIYPSSANIIYAKDMASKGYNGVIAYTRGKWLSNDTLRSFEHDGEDANAVIDWIVQQPWSNGKVGMMGGSYLGFAQWATVKKLHPALKTIVPQVAVGIGVDYPMQNNVFMSYMLRWIHYIENNKNTDIKEFRNTKKWNTLYSDWFESGRAFRTLDSIDGRPNDTFQRWLDHPSRDEFWQNMVADKDDFSKINIPILTTTGYFDDDQTGALYYLKEHYKYFENPEHYLVIGPYNHGGAQGVPRHELGGYALDSVAKISIDDLAFEWFDYVLKGNEKPILLKDKVNYQVMEANTWKHTTSLDDLHKKQQTFYLSEEKVGETYQLQSTKGNPNNYISQVIDFSDRKKLHKHYDFQNSKIVDTILKTNNGLVFKTAPFEQDIEINGSFSGELSVMINKKDMDYTLLLYEQKVDGSYFYLSNYIQRASYSESNEVRKLLTPNQKTKLAFKDTYFTSKKIAKGSRLILIVNINKDPQWEVNYGTGKEVSRETIKDAGEPLQVKWFTDSYIKIPVN
jgi:putative CocE/NonD family hydrolase